MSFEPTLENLTAAIHSLSPDEPETEWFRIACAVADGCREGGHPVSVGADLFDEWSRGGVTYDAAQCRSSWRGANKDGAVKVGTLWHKAMAAGWRPENNIHKENEHERTDRERRRAEYTERSRIETEAKAKRASAKAAQASKCLSLAQKATDDNPYLLRKGVKTTSTLFEWPIERIISFFGYHPKDRNGAPLEGLTLIVPVKVLDNVSSLEFIDGNGRKSVLSGSVKTGGYWATARLPDGAGNNLKIIIAEGVSTSLSILEATGQLIIAALSNNNLEKVAREMRQFYPNASITIATDLLKDTGKTDPYSTKAAGICGGNIAIPDFGEHRPTEMNDFNDLHKEKGLEAVKRCLDVVKWPEREVIKEKSTEINPPSLTGFSLEELNTAKLHPPCIVENYLYADLALIAAPGGIGKTTLLLWEAIIIAIGRNLYGQKVRRPGATLFITAEDSRDIYAARLRELTAEMGLTEYEKIKVLERINVWDVSAELIRLAELDKSGNITLTPLADKIVDTYRGKGLVQIVFDPTVSFGPGERLVNDSEQSIVTACRRIIRGLGNCCVRMVHHTGKANARAGAIDQYASRGGTALPDGSRMVTMLSNVSDESTAIPPEGWELEDGDSGFLLNRPKLSYCKPQPLLWIRRRGWKFEHFAETPRRSGKQVAQSDTEVVHKFLSDEIGNGRRYTARQLDAMVSTIDLSRIRLRNAVARLEVDRRCY